MKHERGGFLGTGAERSVGFAGSESGLLMVVDPTALIPYLHEGVIEDWIARSLAALGGEENEIALGAEGGQAVILHSSVRGRHVLVKERLGDGALRVKEDIKDAG